MASNTLPRKVDYSALRTNQGFIISLLVLAFVADTWWLVAFVALVMLVGTAVTGAALFKRIYRHVLRPVGLVKPDVVTDNPEPHNFAQGFGGAFLAGSTASLLLGASLVGWALAWVVIALAALNLFGGFCVGCFLYYQLNKLGTPGFAYAPQDANVLPGRQPRKAA
jgi:hypothetical protein